MSTGKVNLIIPIRSVEKGALVLLESWDCRPLPVIQDTRGVYQDIAMIGNSLATPCILDVYVITALRLVPVCASDLVLRLDIFVQTVFSCKVVEVLENLLG